MKIAYRPAFAAEEIIFALRAIPDVELAVATNRSELAVALADAQVLVTGGPSYDAETAKLVRDGAPRLRLIQSFSAGYDAMQAHGVPAGVIVATPGDAWSPAVAEHSMALLLAIVKRLPDALDNQRCGRWDRGFANAMQGLDGRTLVVVGYGSIGREFARRARAFGMHIVGLSRSARPDSFVDESLPISELIPALARADVVLVATPYSRETHHLIGRDALGACKPTAVLLNPARGGLVDPDALADALRSGRLGGAGIDVTEPEPLPDGHPLWIAPNLVITPHVAGSNGQSGRDRVAAAVATNVARFVRGQPVLNVAAL